MTDTYQPTAQDALDEIRTNATSLDSAMPPEGFAAALRDWIAQHDADLIELLLGTVPHVYRQGERMLRYDELQTEANRRRVGLN